MSLCVFLAFHRPWAETMTPVKTLRQASEPFTHPPPPKTKQDSFVTDVFGLFRFLNVLYVVLRILLRFFSRHFIDSPSDGVNVLECRRSEGQTAPPSMSTYHFSTAYSSSQPYHHQVFTVVWQQVRGKSHIISLTVLAPVCAVKPAGHRPEWLLFRPLAEIKLVCIWMLETPLIITSFLWSQRAVEQPDRCAINYPKEISPDLQNTIFLHFCLQNVFNFPRKLILCWTFHTFERG